MTLDPLTPPNSPQAERSVLGGMLTHPEVIPEIATLTTPEAFFDSRRGVVFREIVQMYRSGVPVNALTLGPRSATQNAWGEGAVQELGECLGVACTPGTAAYWAKQIAGLAMIRRIALVGANLAMEAPTWGDRSATEFAQRALEQITAATRNAQAARDVALTDAAAEVITAIHAGQPELLPTGMPELDETIIGLPRKGVVTVMGTPNSGKTTLCLNVLLRMARLHTIGVRVFSREQGPRRIAATLMSGDAAMPVHRYLNMGIKPPAKDFERLESIRQDYATIDFALVEESLNAGEIYTRCAAYARQGVGAVMIDYLQNLPPLPGFPDQTGRLKESMRVLAAIARDFPMLVVIVSQMTNEAVRADRAPKMGDGAGAGEIQQASDTMLGLYRPHQHEVPEKGDGFDSATTLAHWRENQKILEVHVMKAKFQGKGVANLLFDGETMRFGGKSWS